MPDPISGDRPSYNTQALLNAQPVIVAVIDPDTYRVQFQNETGLRKFGDISGQTCHEKIAGCPAPCAFCKMPDAVRTGEITANEVPLPQNQYVLIQWSKAVTADGRIHVIETITDITERKRLEDAARRAEKMDALGRLAGGMAHDFNNLLTVINAYSERVLDELDEQDPHRSSLKRILEATERAGVLTRNLVALSHHQVLQPALHDLNGVLADMEPRIRRLIGAHIALSMAPHSDVGQIVIDREQLEQIVGNLVGNAREAMPQGGEVTIVTRAQEVDEVIARWHNARPGVYARLSVTDTGPGMDRALQARIFEPFFAGPEPSERGGLGLANVRGIVEQAGGFIECSSELSRGSTFTVFLPRCEPMSAVPPVAQPPESSSGTKTILLVEDDEDVRRVVADMLRAHGYQVREAADGADALQRLRADPGHVNLVLTDVMMPRMTGPQLVKQLETRVPSVKILYMSGYPNEILEPAAGQPLAFIQKPFSAPLLIKKVRETLTA